jgi:hypothetical protein
MTTEMESREITTAPYELVSEPGGVLARINVRGSRPTLIGTAPGFPDTLLDHYWVNQKTEFGS